MSCFGSAHRTLFPKKYFRALDVFIGNFLSLHHTLICPSRGIFFFFIERIGPGPSHGVKPWPCCVCRQHRKIASHIASLPECRWDRKKKCLEFSCSNTVGKAAIHVGLPHEKTCRYKGGGGVMAGGREIPSL